MSADRGLRLDRRFFDFAGGHSWTISSACSTSSTTAPELYFHPPPTSAIFRPPPLLSKSKFSSRAVREAIDRQPHRANTFADLSSATAA
jgi:hypothetical protein